MFFLRKLFCCCCPKPSDDDETELIVIRNANDEAGAINYGAELELPRRAIVGSVSNTDLITDASNSNQFDATELDQEQKLDQHRNRTPVIQPHQVSPEVCLQLLQNELDCSEVIKLGSGAFGTAWSVRPPVSLISPLDTDASIVVVKTFHWGLLSGLHFKRSWAKEANAYEKISRHINSHPNIVNYYKSFKIFVEEDQSAIKTSIGRNLDITSDGELLVAGVVIEKAEMTLDKWLEKVPADEALLKRVFKQIGGALIFLHDIQLTHNDLKTDNIGVFHIDSDGMPELKLIDFSNAYESSSANHYRIAEEHSKSFKDFYDLKQDDEPERAAILRSIYLEESHDFGGLIERIAITPIKTQRFCIYRRPEDDDARRQFHEKNFEDQEFKRTIERMFTPARVNRITIKHAMQHLENNL